MSIKVARMSTDDPNIKVYGVRIQLTEQPIEVALRGEPGISAIAELFLEVRGVAGVQVFPYYVAIVKGPAFEWQEIEPSLLPILSGLNREVM